MRQNPVLVPELREMLAGGDAKSLREFCEAGHPATVAELVSALPANDVWSVIKHADTHLQAEIFCHLEYQLQMEIVAALRRQEIARLFADMPPDNRADLFRQLPEDLRETVLPALAQAEREDIRRLTAYREGTAGAVMTSDYASLPPHVTAVQAIEHLREVAPDKETIYYAYVVNDQRKLIGYVSLKDLIVARRQARVGDIMHSDVIFARVEDDQEDAARKIQKFDLLALPVIDDRDTLVGIITHDDAIDIVTQEHTEDMEKFMAIVGSHADAVYMRTSIWGHFRNRSPWVVALALLGLVSGFIVQHFEGLLMQLTFLAAFMPLLADTGGNTGSQSATLVIRALALKEISPRDFLRILGREFQIALLLGGVLAMLAFARVVLLDGGSTVPLNCSLARIGIAISLALGLQVVSSTLVGALLPLAAARMRLDPAVVASPALTTIVDITGLLIYFGTVKLFLGL